MANRAHRKPIASLACQSLGGRAGALGRLMGGHLQGDQAGAQQIGEIAGAAGGLAVRAAAGERVAPELRLTLQPVRGGGARFGRVLRQQQPRHNSFSVAAITVQAAHTGTKTVPAGPPTASAACSSVGSSSFGDALLIPLFSSCSHRRLPLLWCA
jgi:hypothetical protein